MQRAGVDLDKLVFSHELIGDIQEEISPLLRLHFEEISHYPDIPLDPDWDRYQQLQDAGMFVIFTAREDSKLIGYNAFFLNTNIHYKSSRQAIQDVIFIDPTKRGFGKIFIQWCDEQLGNLGTQVIYHHLKAAKNFGPMLESIGYELIDLIYGKRLDVQHG